MPERLRETQAQRRTRLLDAAVQSLVEVGYAGTTTLEVQQRAGCRAARCNITSRPRPICSPVP